MVFAAGRTLPFLHLRLLSSASRSLAQPSSLVALIPPRSLSSAVPPHLILSSRFPSSTIPPRPRADIDEFLAMYPRFKPNPSNTKNVDFYQGREKALPDGLRIDDMLDRLENNWGEIESNHGFIQWLFPIPEHGVNWESQPLEPHEAAAISSDPVAMERFLRAYEMMFAFYGIRMVDRNLGVLARADNAKQRFAHLLSHPHNLLRITRILKCLTILSPPSSSLLPSSLPSASKSSPPSSSSTTTANTSPPHSLSTAHHAPSLILFLLAQHNDLRLNLFPATMAGGSLDRFWAGCLRAREEREWVGDLVEGRKKWTAEGRLVGRVEWGEKEYEEWVRGRFDEESENEVENNVEELVGGDEEKGKAAEGAEGKTGEGEEKGMEGREKRAA